MLLHLKNKKILRVSNQNITNQIRYKKRKKKKKKEKKRKSMEHRTYANRRLKPHPQNPNRRRYA
jgi:hypothetical protein